jgi:phosphatidate phosphatase APP1
LPHDGKNNRGRNTLRAVLTSDLSDPNSVANKQTSASYRALAAAFNFQTDGTIAARAQAQSADQLNHAVDLYSADYDDSAISAEKIETAYNQQRIGSITTVDDLLKDSRLYNYVLKAFGLDPSSESKIRLKLV